jgi:hypothetical protein
VTILFNITRKENETMKKLALFSRITLFLALVFTVSCSTTKLTSVWRDEGYQGHPRKIMVIGVVKYPEIRKLIEDEFVRQFRDRGVEAVAGYTILPDTAVVDKNVIIEKMNALGTDTMLIARHVDQRTAMADVPGTSWYGYYGVHSAGVVATDKYALMQTKVYDLKTEQPVWSASSETWLTANVPDRTLIQEFITAVLNQMASQKIIASGAGK